MNKCARCYFNIPKHISTHLFGENHTTRHHKIVGAALMSIGVGIAMLNTLIEVRMIHFTADLVGYALHGVGLTPFIKAMENV